MAHNWSGVGGVAGYSDRFVNEQDRKKPLSGVKFSRYMMVSCTFGMIYLILDNYSIAGVSSGRFHGRLTSRPWES
jgi:hypothetical protein